jgi:hypothetical protein
MISLPASSSTPIRFTGSKSASTALATSPLSNGEPQRTSRDLASPANYSAWSLTDDGFFRNKGIDPFAFDSALQMKVDVVPEPSTWA